MNQMLTIVIPTCRRSPLLERTLKSLAACELPETFRGIVVVENGGRCGAETIVAQTPATLKARYLYHAEGNKSAALNAVLDTAVDDFLLFLDDDVRVAPDLLTRYAEAAVRFGCGHFFGGPMGVDYEVAPPDWLRQHLPDSAVGWEPDSLPNPVREPCFLGCNWGAFAADLRAAGGFETHLGPGAATGSVGQDHAMQAQLLERGCAGHLVEGRVWHYVPQDRCSLRWALQRARRHAIRAGLHFEDTAPRLLGVPRWMWRLAAQKYAGACWRSLTASRRNAFEAWLEYYKVAGLTRGVRLRASEQNRVARGVESPATM